MFQTWSKRKEKLEISNLSLEDYTGNFYSAELDAKYLLFIEGEKLKVKVANYEAQELNLYDVDTFNAEIGLLRFYKSNEEVKGFELDAGRVTNLKFEKK